MPSARKEKTPPGRNRREGSPPGEKKLPSRTDSAKPQMLNQPKSPFPPQHQPKPGLESRLKPRPEYQAPFYTGSGKLTDKSALITGGDSGIGRAVAVLFAREGANVAIVYLQAEQEDAEETRRAVESEGMRCKLLPGDVRDSRFCRDAVNRTIEDFGQLDILVNNAAYQNAQERIEEITEEQWDNTFRTN